ncbi:MAG TPA: triose-phosphate isomerase [Acidimicrobiales bacterium]|nr:triose-phosphate isomerase [Acidimicrobiales bacterium]
MAKPARKPLVSGNWKMHLTHLEAINIIQKLSYSLDASDPSYVDISVHPAFTALRSVQTVLEADDIRISLGAQNVHWETSGAVTGEVSPGMLAKLNVAYVIVGHSERRQLFGESDEMVNKKVKAVFAAGMTPIMCVGETLDEREAGDTESRVIGQLEAGLSGLNPEQVAAMVIAYEPIWAIGTGRNATPDDAQAVCQAIRSSVLADHGDDAGARVRVQYGGSVKAVNAAELMAQPDIDGALVGGASLDPAEFAQIIAFARH